MRGLSNVSRFSPLVFKRSIVTREPVELAFTLHGNPLVDRAVPPLVISHGLFAHSNSWNSVAQTLSKRLNTLVLAFDTRNHGCSPHSSSMTFAGMAADLTKFLADRCEEFNVPQMNLLGHSMGGKTAMMVAVDPHASKYIDRLIIEDVSPRGYKSNHDVFRKYVSSMRTADLSKSRKEILHGMEKNIPELAIRQFLLTNLHSSSDGRLEWKCNISAIDKHLMELLEFANPAGVFSNDTLFLHSATSGYVPNSDYQTIRTMFPQVEIEVISKAGHMIHAEQPTSFVDSLCRFLQKN